MNKKLSKTLFSFLMIGMLFTFSCKTNSKLLTKVSAVTEEPEENPFTDPNFAIAQVGFVGVKQPEPGVIAPTTVRVAIDAKYTASINWSPSLIEGKFDYDTVYTAEVVLQLTANYIDQGYYFSDDVQINATSGIGWQKTSKSTKTKLCVSKIFARTTNGKVVDSYSFDENDHLIVHLLDGTTIDAGYVSNENLPTSFEINNENHLIVYFANNSSSDLGYVGNDNTLPTTLSYIGIGLGALNLIGIIILIATKKGKRTNEK